MRKSRTALAVLLLLAGLGAVAQEAQGSTSEDWSRKVDPLILQRATDGPLEFIVFLSEQADLSGASSLCSKREKGEYVYRALTGAAERTQGPILEELRLLGAKARPFWVANMVVARGDLTALRAMAERPEVRRVLGNPLVPLRSSPIEAQLEEGPAPAGVPWNVAKVRAPEAWALGFEGQGVVVAINDTGTDWTHPALKSHYRGWDGSAADHNFNWHDAVHTDAGKCGHDVPYPCDAYGHGTPVAGTVDGDDGAGNRVGVAPGAKWIACRCMDTAGYGSPARYSECLQWFIAPTDLGGQNPDPAKAPDIANNSWGCVAQEGCTDPLVLKAVVESVKAAGIALSPPRATRAPGAAPPATRLLTTPRPSMSGARTKTTRSRTPAAGGPPWPRGARSSNRTWWPPGRTSGRARPAAVT